MYEECFFFPKNLVLTVVVYLDMILYNILILVAVDLFCSSELKLLT